MKYLSPGHVSIAGEVIECVDGVVDIPPGHDAEVAHLVESFGLTPVPEVTPEESKSKKAPKS